MLRKRQDREAEGLSITDGTPSGAGPGTRERIRGGLKKLLRGKKRKVIALVLVASIAGGVVVILIAIAYIVLKKRYWFW